MKSTEDPAGATTGYRHGSDPWFLAQVRPNCFHIAQRNLERQGFPVFCPLLQETRRRAGRFVSVAIPLFPGYLFVGFDPSDSPWRAINSTYGVTKLVTFGLALPTPAPAGLVSGLMERCDDEGKLLPRDRLSPGDEVRVAKGPFSNFIATVESLAPQRRVWLLLDLFGRTTRIAVSASDVVLT